MICAVHKTHSILEFLDIATSWCSHQKMRTRTKTLTHTGMHEFLVSTMQIYVIQAQTLLYLGSPSIWNFFSCAGLGVIPLFRQDGKQNVSSAWDLSQETMKLPLVSWIPLK